MILQGLHNDRIRGKPSHMETMLGTKEKPKEHFCIDIYFYNGL